MKKAFVILAGILVLLALAALVVPPMAGGWLSGRIAAAVRENAGHDLVIEDFDVSVLPTIRASASRVVLRDGSGSGGPPLLDLGPTEMEVALAPLMTGTLDVTRLEVDGARAQVRVDEKGHPNWVPARGGGGADPQPERAGPVPEEPAGFSDVRFRNVQLSDVHLAYEDRATGRSVTLTDGRFGLHAPGLDAPAEIQGRAIVNGRPVDMAGSIGSPRAILKGQPTTATARIDAAELALASLNLMPAEGDSAVGKLRASIPSMGAVLAWLAIPAESYAGPQSLAFEAGLRLADGRAEIADLSLRADDVTAQGKLTVDTRGERPRILGELTLSEVRLDRFLPAEASQDAKVAGRAGGSTGPARARGGRTPQGPDDAPVPWGNLKQFDAELIATVDGIVFRQDRIGRTRFDLRLNDGVMDARLNGDSLLGGKVQAVMTADAGANTMAVKADLDGIRFAPLVARFSDLGLAEGSASGAIDLKARGKTRAELAQSMQGRARLAATGQGLRVPQPGKPLDVGRFAVTLDMPSAAGPLTLAGDASLQKDPIAFRLNVARPTDLAGGRMSPVALDIDGALGTARFEGEASTGNVVSGQVALDILSLPKLAALLGTPLPPDLQVTRIRYEGGVRREGETAAFEGFALTVDEVEAKGMVTADWSGPVPGIVARVALSPLDLNRLLPPDRPTGRPPNPAPAPPPGAAPPSGWSDEPIGFEALRAFDLDATVESAGLTVDDIRLGASTIRATLKGGALAVDSAQVPAFDGRADVSLRIDAGKAPATLGLILKAEGARAEKILAALAGNEIVTGDTVLDVDVTASGNSQRALVSSLNGTTGIHLKNGALRGINIAAILRDPVAAATGRLADAARETDFTDLSGSFRIANGVAATDDLRMSAPLFRITGSGIVSLPDRRLDLRLDPTAVASLEGQGATFEKAGLKIPVLIRGTFESPQVQPDFTGIATTVLQDPAKAAEAVRRLSEGGSAKEIFEALTGGATPAAPATPPEPAPSGSGSPPPPAGGSPTDLLEQGLKQLFGR